MEKIGRSSARIAALLREKIASGDILSGQYLPTIRGLGKEHGVSNRTVMRGMKLLEADGLVVCDARRGYRVVRRVSDPEADSPLAYVSLYNINRQQDNVDNEFHLKLLGAMNNAAIKKGSFLLALAAGSMSEAELVSRLQSQGAFGIALDTSSNKILQAAKSSGIPGVMIDSWIPDTGIDSIMQDGQLGGIQAASYLIKQGCKRIAWFGRAGAHAHGTDRLSGVLTGLAEAGRSPAEIITTEHNSPEMDSAALRMLQSPDRPEGVASLWLEHAAAVKRAAEKLGIIPGKDIEIVTWCADELIDSAYRGFFQNGYLPPVVTWRIKDMAQTVMARLTERCRNRDLPPLRIKIPTQLIFPEQGD